MPVLAPRREEKEETCPVFNIRGCFEMNKDRDVVERGWQDEREDEETVLYSALPPSHNFPRFRSL